MVTICSGNQYIVFYTNQVNKLINVNNKFLLLIFRVKNEGTREEVESHKLPVKNKKEAIETTAEKLSLSRPKGYLLKRGGRT